jgi:hypothetical protein
MNFRLIKVLRIIACLIPAALAGATATAAAEAECSGCLCSGNPCRLCPLPPSSKNAPAMQDEQDEPDACRKIREKVPPVSANTEPDEHYASLDKSIMECVRNGGDVVMNSRRNKEFPSKHYCKPYLAPGASSAAANSSRTKK